MPHQLLSCTLVKTGIHGKLLKVIRSMYSKLLSCVLTKGKLTEYFQCPVGTRQGCMISPLLFVLYLNQLSDLYRTSDCQGIYIDECFPNVGLGDVF